jgi:hypothetical protein
LRAVSDATPLHTLTPRELQALRGAAIWYAKYHAGTVEEHARDKAAYAVSEREEYLDLVAALAKLGVKIRLPDALAEMSSAA